jgi:hexosaminidase
VTTLDGLVPIPASVRPGHGTFEVTAATRVVCDAAARPIVERFAAWLRAATSAALPVESGGARDGDIAVTVDGAGVAESYSLTVAPESVRVVAADDAGAFRALTTLRQLLPLAAESATLSAQAMTIPCVAIDDRPRFTYRGFMLDVARHFFPADDVVRLLDQMALLKLNALHLHLADDQGWRLPVPAWPRLTEVGGPSDIDGGPGGSYTADDLAAIASAAAERFVTVVPEVDLPGHTTAALVAYPELAADGVRPEPFHRAGISRASVAVGSEVTARFVADVIDAAAGAFAGDFLHLGGDEADGTDAADFDRFVPDACRRALAAGRTPIVWHEGARTDLPAETVVQYWGFPGAPAAADLARRAVGAGHRLIVSPADRIYLDMRYDDDTPYGLTWAGTVSVRQSYEWDPATLLDGVGEADVLGVEAPMWTETTPTREALDQMVFPRLACAAEIAWSPRAGRSWDDFRRRLAGLGHRWDALGVGHHRSFGS